MKTYTFIMGPQLKMSFKIGDYQGIDITHQNGEDSIIIYNDLYHTEALLEIQFYDDIKYYMGTYKRSDLTYIVGKNPEDFNAIIKAIIDHTADISVDCYEMTYEKFFKTIEWLVDSPLEPNKGFIFEYTIDNNSNEAIKKEKIKMNEKRISNEDWLTKLNDYEYVKFIDGKVVIDPNYENDSESIHEDSVNHPSHYETGKFECFDVMREVLGDDEVKAFCIANAFKYIYRHKRKNGIEDIKKAKWYIDKYLELEESNND